MALGRGRARRPMLQRRRLTRTTHLPEIERRTGRWRVGPQCLNERRRCITPRRVPPLELPPHMGSATTAPARSTNYVVNHMCEHICEPIHSTGRILPGEPSITMCGENTAYARSCLRTPESRSGSINGDLAYSRSKASILATCFRTADAALPIATKA